MLPDVSKRRNLFGFDRKRYDSTQIHKIIDLIENDGFTSKNCVGIIKRMNGYLEESKYLVLELSTIFYFMKDLNSGVFNDSDCKVLRVYAERIDRGLSGRSMKNIMKMIKSLASQRRLVFSVKRIIKLNKISKDWEDLLSSFMDDLESRMKYLKAVGIPANIEITPLGPYVNYLSKSGTEIYDDIRLFVDDGKIFEDDDESVLMYKNHVIDVLKKIDDDMLGVLLEQAKHGMELRNKRIEQVRDSIAAEKAASISAALEEYGSIVLGLCSNAEKSFIEERKDLIAKTSDFNAEIYVIAAANVNAKRVGYLKKTGKGKYSVSSIKNASVFKKDEAEKAAQLFRSSGENRIAEVAKIELYSYGFGL